MAFTKGGRLASMLITLSLASSLLFSLVFERFASAWARAFAACGDLPVQSTIHVPRRSTLRRRAGARHDIQKPSRLQLEPATSRICCVFVGFIVCGVGARKAMCGPATSRGGRNGVRGVASRAVVAETVEDLRALRLRDLKAVMAAAGLNVAGCVDRESLMEVLAGEGAADRVLSSLAARAEASRPRIGEVQVSTTDSFISLELNMAPSGKVGRFMIDTNSPFTIIDNAWAQQVGAKLVPGGDATAPKALCGTASFGSFDCGNFLAVPVQMPMPPGCSGLLSVDFLQQFDWEFDLPRGLVRVASVPSPDAAVGFNVDGLRKVPLTRLRKSVGGRDVELLSVPVKLRKDCNSSSMSCTGVLDLTSVTGCNDGVVKGLGLTVDDFIGDGKQVQGFPFGTQQICQEAKVLLTVGDDTASPTEIETQILAGHPVVQKMGFAAGEDVVILGLDALRQSRFVMSFRSGEIWTS